MNAKVEVWYHANCVDGFAAAYILRQHYKDVELKFVPVQYGQPPPVLTELTDLYIVDFSYPLETLKKLTENSNLNIMVVIDHHITAEGTLKEFDVWARSNEHKVLVIFDKEKSGAVLTWKYCHSEEDEWALPELYSYVQDRDLWQWKCWQSRAVNLAIRSYPMTFEAWDLLMKCPTVDLKQQGDVLKRNNDQVIAVHVKGAVMTEIGGHLVPCVNATSLMSEIGEALCEAYSDAPFAATYFIKDNKTIVYSLRSKGFDVGAVAKRLGGGGHKQSAGFSFDAVDVFI